jgi:hypothetical protein
MGMFPHFVPNESENALAAAPLGAPIEPHAEVRFELPPSFRPHMKAIETDPVRVQDEARPLASIADVGINEIAAPRPLTSSNVDDELQSGISAMCAQTQASVA